MVAVLVLRRRGARDDAVLRPGDGLRDAVRGGVPDHAAGRRGAPRAALQPLLRAGARPRRHVREPARARAPRSSPTTSSRSSTATSSTPATALVADPRDLGAKVDFVTTYHMVIEGTLALTGQHFITPRVRGARHPARLHRGLPPDRHRRAPPRRLRHLVPAAEGRRSRRCGGASPTGSSRCCRPPRACSCRPAPTPTNWTLLGYGAEEINTFAFTALTRRLKVIGVDLAAAVGLTVRTLTSAWRAPRRPVTVARPQRDATSAEEVSRPVTTTMCFDPRIPNRAARGLVHAGLLADTRVS